VFIVIVVLFVVEWLGRSRDFAILAIGNIPVRSIRWAVYYVLIFTILYYFKTPLNYIYFQF